MARHQFDHANQDRGQPSKEGAGVFLGGREHGGSPEAVPCYNRLGAGEGM